MVIDNGVAPKVIDIFSFNGELDLLEIRLHILNDVVDEFIVCESDETFTGVGKPLYYQENEERYSKWKHKIKHFLMSKPDDELLAQAYRSPGVPQHLHWWVREFCQKESMKRALTHLKNDDLVFIGDADEIWNPDVLDEVKEHNDKLKLEQVVYAYYLNNRSDERHPGSDKGWLGTFVAPYRIIKTDTLDNLRSHDAWRKHMLPAILEDGGWHFTNMGGAEFIKRKLASYSHQEFNHEGVLNNIENQIALNQDFIGRDFIFTIDETGLPEYILNNKELYPHLWKTV